jgi:energy-coupling factor transporter ATP-binding protein EcfA2
MSTSVIPESPVAIAKLDLRDVRGIRNLLMPFVLPRPGVGQWVVLLGRNGVGKTTLLRSIAIACRNAQDPSIWPDDAFSLPWPHTGAEQARITVTLSDGIVYESRIRSEGGLRVVQQPEHTRPRLFPLFGYGCRRGSALGGKSREVNLKDDGGPEVATLFSEGRDLIHAETWLLILDGDASRNPQMLPVYKATVSALISLLDVEDLTIVDRRVWVTERGGRRILFEALSDGYLTTAGWFLDLVARWIELLARNEILVAPDFLSTARGLVLIDELDLHLHPRWQCEVIGRVRRLLPEMSFIVTTHNPLTLVGARPEEVWVLSSNSDQILVRAGVEVPMLLTSGQILRQYFDIADIYPDSLGRALQRYGFLSAYSERNATEEQEMAALASELSAAGLLPQWEVIAPAAAGKSRAKSRSQRTNHRKDRE